MPYTENRAHRDFIITDNKKRKHRVSARSSLEAAVVYDEKPLFFGEALSPPVAIEDTKPYV